MEAFDGGRSSTLIKKKPDEMFLSQQMKRTIDKKPLSLESATMKHLGEKMSLIDVSDGQEAVLSPIVPMSGFSSPQTIAEQSEAPVSEGFCRVMSSFRRVVSSTEDENN